MEYKIYKVTLNKDVWYEAIVKHRFYFLFLIPYGSYWSTLKDAIGKNIRFKSVEHAEYYINETYGKPSISLEKEGVID
jgi:hypothetical protein